jgi:hypothetical protein
MRRGCSSAVWLGVNLHEIVERIALVRSLRLGALARRTPSVLRSGIPIMAGTTAMKATLRSVQTTLRPVKATLRPMKAALRAVVCRRARGTVMSGLFVRRRRAYRTATGNLRMRCRSICHAHAAHRLPSRHVLVVRRERLKARLAMYRTTWLLHRSYRRLATIKRHEVVAVSAGDCRVPRLHRRRTKTPFASRNDLAMGRSCGYSAVTAVIAYATVRDEMIVDDGSVGVHVTDDGSIHVRDGRIIVECSASPETAHVADTEIAEAVVDSAVETDARAPITLVPYITRERVTPVAWRPIHADRGRRDPGARDPIVSIRVPRPVPGIPHVVRTRRRRLLLVFGKRRGRHAYRRADARDELRSRRQRHGCDD